MKYEKYIQVYSLSIILLLLMIITPDVNAASSSSSTIPSSGSITYPSTESTRIKRVFMEGSGQPSSVYAEKADLYMGHIEQAWRVDQIKAMNPDVICLLYRNIRAVKERYPDEYQTFLDNDWILKDATGTKIYSISFSSNWIIDVGNPAVQDWIANWFVTNIGNYDGAYLDNCLPSTEILWSVNSKPAINPRTGQEYTSDEFEADIISLVNKIKTAIAPKLVVGNGILHGTRFFEVSRYGHYSSLLLNSQIDAILSEGWLSTISSPEWYSENKWKDSIDFVVWLENNFLGGGRMFHPVAHNVEPVNNQGPSLPAGCTQEQYVTYNFASLLLGATRSETHYINFGYYLSDYLDSLLEVDPGSPLGSYYMVSGTHVYAREFSNIKVLVNPTYQGYSVSLDGGFETLDGTPVGSTIWMSPHTGMILIRTSTPPPPPPPPPPSGSVFETGFESGSFGDWDGVYTTSGETANVVSTLPRSGVYHASFTTDGGSSTARAYAIKRFSGLSEVYARADVYVDSGQSMSAWDGLWLFEFYDSGGSHLASYGFKADGTGTKWTCRVGSQNSFGDSGPVEDRWYVVEAYYRRGSSGDTVVLYVDGEEVASLAVGTSSDAAEVRVGIPYNSPGYNFRIYTDNVAVN